MIEIIRLCSSDRLPFIRKISRRLENIMGIKNDISVVVVSEKKIARINKVYRKKKFPTDALSFEEADEIFICPAYIEKKNRHNRKKLFCELTKALVHAILHLRGYDHEASAGEARKMEKEESRIIKKIKINL